MNDEDVTVDGDEWDVETGTHDKNGAKEDVKLAEINVESPSSVVETVCKKWHDKHVEEKIGGWEGSYENVVRFA